MTTFKYEMISDDEKRAQIEGRLRGLETEHYLARLDILTAQDEGAVTDRQARASELETQITKLRDEAKSLNKETK